MIQMKLKLWLILLPLFFFILLACSKNVKEQPINEIKENGNLKVREEYPCYADQEKVLSVNQNDRYSFTFECESAENWTRKSSTPEIEIWKDNTTGLYWTEILTKNLDERMTWEEASNFCLQFDAFQKNDWRLPTKDEVMQIAPKEHEYGYKEGNDMHNAVGEDFTQYSLIWTKTEVEEMINSAWTVSPYNGFVLNEIKTNKNDTRCVARY